MKVVINSINGGFGLSRAAFLRLRELGNAHALAEPDLGEMYPDGSGPRRESSYQSFGRGIPRNDAQLIEVVEAMGALVNAPAAKLRIIDIPDDVAWQVEEYDGREWIAEKHRTWGDD